MPQLHLFLSNRVEVLADRLAEVTRTPLSSPLQSEIIVVQSQGMARWLALALADRNGICANMRFPFPKAFEAEIFKSLPGSPGEAAADPETLVWRVLKLLPTLAENPGFVEVKHYLGDGQDFRKQFQLADRIAWLFDQYLVYRPDWILQWEAGGESHWQAVLWRHLASSLKSSHPARLRQQFAAHLATSQWAPAGLPERISIFGISALPPMYVELFAAIAQKIDVHLFSLQPSRNYWGEIVSPREAEKILRRKKNPAASAGDLHLENGNRLLASMGRMGREFLNLLIETGDWNETDQFVEPGRETLLRAIQSDVLNRRERTRDDEPRTVLQPGDDSVQVHSCHSSLREMEVLQDHILHWFESDPELEPRDILVMMPDVESHAPLVEAVFDSPEDEARRIPFSIADRGGHAGSNLVETFLELLKFPGSRLGAATVLSILEHPMVRGRFGLEAGDLDMVRTWIEETGIRWGIDAEHRATFDLPGFSENAWRQGLDRLLLGYAMKGDGEQLFEKCLPHEDIEGAGAAILGHLLEFADKLFGLVADLRVERSVYEWVARLNRILDEFFLIDETVEIDAIAWRGSIFQLGVNARLADYSGKIGLDVILEALAGPLREERFGAGFLTGGVTFCALKPMRSIPFKIICLLGMDDGAFPRSASRPGFDLMASHPRPGDKSSRDDDRYLFLETILSARQKVYLSYTGQSIRDNRPAPPSVVISELLDYIAGEFQAQNGVAVRDQIVRQHRLQTFSEVYFNGQTRPLFSYSRENSHAGQSARQPRQSPGFFTEPLSPPPETWRAVPLTQLAAFFCHPAKFIATRRLGLDLPEGESALPENEPFDVEGLDRYQIRQHLLEIRMKGANLSEAAELFRATGRLPAGAAGQTCFQELCASVEEYHRTLQRFLPLLPDAREEIERTIGPFQVSGALNSFNQSGLLHYRCSHVNARDRLRLWIQHLARNLHTSSTSILVGSDGAIELHPVAGAEDRLLELLELYWQGSMKPLKFFPQTSLVFAKSDSASERGSSKADPMAAASAEWRNNRGSNESADAYFDLCFHGADPLDEEFETIARKVFGPMLEVTEAIKL